MTAWTCPICEGRGCSAERPCKRPASPRAFWDCPVCDGAKCSDRVPCCPDARWRELPQNAPASPGATHGTSEGSKAPPTPLSVAGTGKPVPVDGPTFWQSAPARPVPGPTSATTLERLVADNQALTEQVTHLQEASNARLALARIRKVLELPEGASDQELVDEVARIRRGLGELWARAVSR